MPSIHNDNIFQMMRFSRRFDKYSALLMINNFGMTAIKKKTNLIFWANARKYLFIINAMSVGLQIFLCVRLENTQQQQQKNEVKMRAITYTWHVT